MSKKALLMILDGWGLGDQKKDDVIFNTPTPYWDYLMNNYPHSQLQASGEDVGLPDGQMGNSEVGHLNIGAGRVVYQDLVKINRACADNSILQNPEIVSAFSYAKENGKSVHFMGLTSNGGVHSSMVHLFKLCDISKEYGIDTIEIHKDAINENDIVLLHDDLLATGGTMKAACDLVKKFHPKKIYANFIIELKSEFPHCREQFDKDIEIESLLQF